MGLPVEGIPEELMYPQKQREFLRWLSVQPMPGYLKSKLLSHWARWVGIRISQSVYARIEGSGGY